MSDQKVSKIVAPSPISAQTTAEQMRGGRAKSSRFDEGMHVIITGSGSALPDPQRGGCSTAVIIDGRILQFDCGRRFMDNMMQAGANPLDIDALCLTHLHFDHIALYSYYLIAAWVAGRQSMVHIIGPRGTKAMNAGALEMHDMDIRFVRSIVKYWPDATPVRPTAEPPFMVGDVTPGVVLDTDAYRVTAVATDHLPDPEMKSLGYKVESRYGSVVISGDTRPVQGVIDLARETDLLIHECQKPDPGMIKGGKMQLKAFQKPDASRPQTGHTSPTELGMIARSAQPKKVIATHLPPYTSVEPAVEMSKIYTGAAPGHQIWGDYIAAIKGHYNGPVILAEDAMVFDIG